MPKRRSRYYFDTVTLSNFALAGRVDLLKDRYGSQLHITNEVLDELSAGVLAGYPELLEIEKTLIRKTFTTVPLLIKPKERDLYRQLLRFLSSGEASCIACAMTRKGVVATDGRAARDCFSERDVPFTGTIGILKACCVEGVLSAEEADSVLHTMIEKGYLSPVRRISDVL